MKKHHQFLATGVLLGALLFTGCKKDLEDTISLENIQSAEDHEMAQAESSSLFDLIETEAPADMQSGARQNGMGPLTACAQRTWNATTKTLTLDFGTTNCLGADGLYRRGKVMAVFNGQRQTAGATTTITLQNYYVNDNQLLGTKVITNLAQTSGQYKYQIGVQGAQLITPEGTISWSSNRTVERIAGNGTVTLADDAYLVSGSSEGTNRRGIDFTSTITQPLKRIFQTGCARTFISGKVTVTNKRGNTLQMNFDPIGGEPCDKIVEVSMNGYSKQITLR